MCLLFINKITIRGKAKSNDMQMHILWRSNARILYRTRELSSILGLRYNDPGFELASFNIFINDFQQRIFRFNSLFNCLSVCVFAAGSHYIYHFRMLFQPVKCTCHTHEKFIVFSTV